MSLIARDLSLDDVLLIHARRPPFETDMPISFKVEARVAANSAIQALQGRFSLGAGYFKLDDPDHEPFLVDEATGDVAWDAAGPSLSLQRSAVVVRDDPRPRLGLARAADAGAGRVGQPSRIRRHGLRRRRGRARSRSSSIRPSFDARYLPQESRFVLDRLSVHGPSVNGAASGETAAVGGGDDAQAEFAGRPERRRRRSQAMAELHQRRRARLVPGAHSRRTSRRRLDERGLGRGRIRSGGSQARRPAPTACTANFRRAETVVDLLPGVPALTGLDASGVITGHDFVAGAKSGVIELSPIAAHSGRRHFLSRSRHHTRADRARLGPARVCRAAPTRSPIS